MSDKAEICKYIERIDLRTPGGPLLGVLVIESAQGFTPDGKPVRVIRQVRLEAKRRKRFFEGDLRRTLAEGAPVIIERVLHRDKSGVPNHKILAE